MPLIVLILLATVFYTLFDFFAARSGNLIDANLGSGIFNAVGAIIPLAIYCFYRLSKGGNLISTQKDGLGYSLLAGISIAIFSILLIKIFEKGGLAYVVPLIYGGSIVLAPFMGWLLLHERVTALQVSGIAVVIIGVGMIILAKAQTS